MFRSFLLLAVFCLALPTHSSTPPWPFPWAEPCEITWENMQGRYLLTDNVEREQLDLKIDTDTKLNFRTVQVTRYGTDGDVIAHGFAWMTGGQKMVRLWLFPVRKGETPSWAIIKFHYGPKPATCAQSSLIPVLTIEKIEESKHLTASYRLLRVSDRKY